MRTRPSRGKNFGPYSDTNPDPAPDCVSVMRTPSGFTVKHFPHVDADKPCCLVTVKPRAGESEIDTLRRADAMVDQKHARAAVA